MVKVGVVGYGVIGQRLADGVALQEDMQLVGVADVAPTLSIKALKERGMPYNLYNALADNQKLFDDAGIPVSGTLEELVDECDILLDATSAGVGAKTESFMKNMAGRLYFRAEKE